MKTTKFVLIAVILSFATMSYTTEAPGPFSEQPTIAHKMTLRAAMQNFDLVVVMHAQIDRSLIENEQVGPYIAQVRYNRVTYSIYGSLEEWESFFSVAIGNNDPPIR